MKKIFNWKPKIGQSYFFVTFDPDTLEFQCDEEIHEIIDNNKFDMPIFPSSEECIEICSYLNGLIEGKVTYPNDGKL